MYTGICASGVVTYQQIWVTVVNQCEIFTTINLLCLSSKCPYVVRIVYIRLKSMWDKKFHFFPGKPRSCWNLIWISGNWFLLWVFAGTLWPRQHLEGWKCLSMTRHEQWDLFVLMSYTGRYTLHLCQETAMNYEGELSLSFVISCIIQQELQV